MTHYTGQLGLTIWRWDGSKLEYRRRKEWVVSNMSLSQLLALPCIHETIYR